MSIKAALFACVIAAGVGCRGDHSSEETGYRSPVESVHETGAGMGAGVANENTGADVTTGRVGQGEVQGRRTAAPTRRATPAPQPTGGFSMGMGTRYSGAGANEAASGTPSSGLNETASGNGTTTNTGTNTENAGNGNTDNPNQ